VCSSDLDLMAGREPTLSRGLIRYD
jgi:hypothetical protein